LYIEFDLNIPAYSILSFAIDFDRAFLHWSEYTPDAHKGYDIGPAVISINTINSTKLLMNNYLLSNNIFTLRNGHTLKMFTEGLYIELPTPDFSMPYNVIILTGTIVALFFGSFVSVLTIRFKTIYIDDKNFISNRPLPSIGRVILKFIDRIATALA